MLGTTLSLLALTIPSARPGALRFMTLKDLVPQAKYSSGGALSPDGSTLAGVWSSEKAGRYFLLKGNGTLKYLQVPPGFHNFAVRGIAPGGVSVTGTFEARDHLVPARWNAATQTFKLSKAEGNVRGVSDDGKVIVGNLGKDLRGPIAVRYGPDLQAAPLPRPKASPYASADAVSGDGKVIAGLLGMRPVRWIAKRLEPLAPSEPGTIVKASAINKTGSVIVGSRSFRARLNNSEFEQQEAVVWRQGKGLTRLGYLPNHRGDPNPIATADAVSADGLLVGGRCATDEIPFRDGKGVLRGSQGIDSAFIWDEKHGLRDLTKLLTDRYGAGALRGWRLCSVNDMSADGRVLIGAALKGDGFTQLYVLRLPVRPDKL